MQPGPFSATGGDGPVAVPAPDDLLACVGHLVGLGLAEGLSSLDWVSRRLGVSRRTLQRRLDERGVRFANLRREVMRTEAERLLADAGRPVATIALDLGYDDPAHFSRAFLTWTGLSPRRWRNALRSG